MAHFVEQYTHLIDQCDDYDILASAIETCISNNVINSVSTDILKAIDRLDLNTPYHKFVKIMVWAATVSDHTETSLNILRYFCNKATNSIDSWTLEPDEYSLIVFAICADSKEFISKLTPDRKNELIDIFGNWYLCWTSKDKEDKIHGLYYMLNRSVDLILQGKMSMQELDWEFRKEYENRDLCDESQRHLINDLIRPFQAFFINLVQNIDQPHLLLQLSINDWTNHMYETIRSNAKRYAEKFGNKGSYMDYYSFLDDFIYGGKTLNDELSRTGYINIANSVVGGYIWRFLSMLHRIYEETDLTTTEIKIILKDAEEILFSNYALLHNTKIVVSTIVTVYCESGRFEDALLEGEYFKAIKAYLDKDEMFYIWANSEANMNEHYAIEDRIYATYVHKYMNPKLDITEMMLEDSSSQLAPMFEVKPETEAEMAPAKESKSTTKVDTSDQEDEDDEEENDNDNEDYESEIDASQSRKGYHKMSKTQADGERKIYSAYKKYKTNEQKVDSQLSKMLTSAKSAFSQDKTEEIIEGKKFTPIGLLKKVLITAAIFNYNKVAGFVYLVVSHTISKKRTTKQKKEILLQIDTEIKMLDEKIEDARGDGNRKAKYALMRTKAELVRARDKIKYNLSATKEDMKTAKSYINNDYRDNI